jgi:mono/diheme cytochrome c family protein
MQGTVRFSMSVWAAVALGAAALAGCSAKSEAPRVVAASEVAAGRYLVTIGGCNDCHTQGWNTSGGKLPEGQWLTGTKVGWQGPWGVTYPQNLRLTAAKMTEAEFVHMLHTRTDRPPMPWMNLNRMNEADAKAIYVFLRSLGPAGEAMPAGTAPGEAVTTPVIPVEPPTPPSTRAANETKVAK